MTVYLQEAKRNPHPDSRTVDDINCFLHNHPCTRCTNHHEKMHDEILLVEGENVPKNMFCGCALNCTLYSDRGTMDIFQNRIFNLLNQDELEEKVASYFDRRRFCYTEGFQELNAVKQHVLQEKILHYLSKVIVSGSKDWDHFNRSQKNQNVGNIFNTKKRIIEEAFCVLMDRPCHRLKTFFEVDDPNARQGPSFQMTYIREWKRLQFQRLGRCTLLQDTNGIGNVACPFGHDSDVKCQTHIASVQVMLNEHDRHGTD